MGIKVTVGEQKPQNDKPFPKLMIHTDGTITYFIKERVGIHLNCVKGYFPKHYNAECHTSISMVNYSDFEGSITLQNEA